MPGPSSYGNFGSSHRFTSRGSQGNQLGGLLLYVLSIGQQVKMTLHHGRHYALHIVEVNTMQPNFTWEAVDRPLLASERSCTGFPIFRTSNLARIPHICCSGDLWATLSSKVSRWQRTEDTGAERSRLPSPLQLMSAPCWRAHWTFPDTAQCHRCHVGPCNRWRLQGLSCHFGRSAQRLTRNQ